MRSLEVPADHQLDGGFYHFDETDKVDGRTDHDVPILTPEEERFCRALIRGHMRQDPGFREDVLEVHPGRGLGKLPPEAELGFAAVALLEEQAR